MKLERTVLILDLYGEEISLKRPTFLEAEQYQEQLRASEKTDETTSVLKSFLEKMGLPKEKFESLEFDHVALILESLLTPKKK